MVFGIKDGVIPSRVPCHVLWYAWLQYLCGRLCQGRCVVPNSVHTSQTQTTQFPTPTEIHQMTIIRSQKGYSLRNQTERAFGTDSHMLSPECTPRPYEKSRSSRLIYVHFPHDLYRVTVIRGAISSGRKWDFIILRYPSRHSTSTLLPIFVELIDFERDSPNHVKRQGPDVVAGVLAHWVWHHHFVPRGTFINMSQIEHCYDVLDETGWFEMDKDPSFYGRP